MSSGFASEATEESKSLVEDKMALTLASLYKKEEIKSVRSYMKQLIDLKPPADEGESLIKLIKDRCMELHVPNLKQVMKSERDMSASRTY